MSQSEAPGAGGGQARGRGPQIAIGIAAAVVVFLLLLVALLVFGEDEDVADLEPTPTATATPTPGPTPTPTIPASPTPPPAPSPTPTVREPTDSDAGGFVAAFEPPNAEGLESVTADVTGDGTREIVFVSRSQGVVRLDVARWDGRAYRITFTDRGGEADEIADFVVADLNGSGTRDILTRQTVGEEGESVSLWGYDGEAIARQVAQGGCWDGSHTYGVVGAEIDDGELVATCDDSPLPRSAWSRDVYVWDDDAHAWAYERTEEP